MGGFECAYAKISPDKRVDLLAQSKHDILCRQDYKLIKTLGIYTVREGLAWSEIDLGKNRYDFRRFEPIMAAGAQEGMQQIWDLNHFDYPDYLDPFTEAFVEQFARYAKRCIRLIRKHQDGTIYIVPINEISFWAHMGGSIGVWAPFALTRGYVFKQQLVKASIAAMKAIWEEDKNVRFIQVDPVFYKTFKKPETIAKRTAAEGFREIKFQAFDMLSGRIHPELGGHSRFLDILGANYYLDNQDWLIGDDPFDETCHTMIPWHSKYRIPFVDILQELYDRYERPIVITETGSYGDWRPRWWKRTLAEIEEALQRELPIYGICAYPIVDRHDWTKGHLTNSGWWDSQPGDRLMQRVPHEATLKIVKPYIAKWNGAMVKTIELKTDQLAKPRQPSAKSR